ncbi:hypothetical protein GCM10029964_034280 [Kibdelosporangium lantanae]
MGATLTLDMEDHTTTDSTLDILQELRMDFPWVGAVIQAYLHRTLGDARDLAVAGSRVRLCKGPTRSRLRSPTRPSPKWTRVTCGACGC